MQFSLKAQSVSCVYSKTPIFDAFTPRDDFKEMLTVIECIDKDKEVVKFTVEGKNK